MDCGGKVRGQDTVSWRVSGSMKTSRCVCCGGASIGVPLTEGVIDL